MGIETSIKGIVEFLKRNDDLIKEIAETGKEAFDTIKELADKVDKARDETRELIERIGTVEFVVSKSSDMREKQQMFLEEIQNVSKKIRRFEAYPDITAHLYAQRSSLYLGLANTYTETIRKIITFTDQEADEIKILLRRAALDSEIRQRKADVLDAAVQLTKLMFKVVKKLA